MTVWSLKAYLKHILPFNLDERELNSVIMQWFTQKSGAIGELTIADENKKKLVDNYKTKISVDEDKNIPYV